MLRSRDEVEASIPPLQDQPADDNSRPKIRRQVMRICDALGVEYDDLAELHLYPGRVEVVTYDRNEEGEFYRNEFGKVVLNQEHIPVDMTTFVGDELDI